LKKCVKNIPTTGLIFLITGLMMRIKCRHSDIFRNFSRVLLVIILVGHNPAFGNNAISLLKEWTQIIPMEGVFQETRHDQFLEFDINYSGKFVRDSNLLKMNYETPVKTTITFNDGMITIDKDNKKIDINTNDHPEFSLLMKTLTLIFRNNLNDLKEDYKTSILKASGTINIILTPAHNDKIINKIIISQIKNKALRISIKLENNDSREIHFLP
jgi:hypothetical protein